MKNLTKIAMATVAAAVVAGSAHAATYNGDLIVGFTLQGANAPATDAMYDLGTEASLFNGKTWSLGTLLSGQSLLTSSVQWGVVGDSAAAGDNWLTKSGTVPNTINGAGALSPITTAIKSIYSLFATAGAGQSTTPAATSANSWNPQTISGSLATTYHKVYANPNTTGFTSENFYQVVDNNSAPSQLGDFSLASDGTLTFNAVAVPEPAAYGLLAGVGLMALALRRQFRASNA